MTDPAGKRIVRGEVALPPGTGPLAAAQVVVRVEDVSRADAPSVVIGEQRFTGTDVAEADRIPFAVEIPADLIDERATYAVSVHVDVSGSGKVERGDLITTQSYPVLTRGYPDQANVQVRKI
jgi:putative lipoprotein